jgi:putative transposase
MGTKTSVELVPTDGSMRDWAEQLVARSRAEGIELTGADGLLTALMRTVLQTGLEVEMAEHWVTNLMIGRVEGRVIRGTGRMRKRFRPRLVMSSLRVPRDRNASFDPVTVPKHVRRLDGLNANVLSLYAKGLTTGEIQAHLLEIYGTELSRDTVSKITDSVVEEMTAWQIRPLERVYAVVLIDAIVVKVRDSQVANRPVFVAIGVTMDGQRDVLGLWLGPTGGEGAKQWMTMLTELRNRGLLDVLIVCCDGLKGLPEAIRTTWPDATVQTCVVHLVRNSLRYASKKHGTQITRGLKQIYTAPTVEAAEARFAEFSQEWGGRYPAMIKSWETSWAEFVPFLEFPKELRHVVYTTNAIESLNARFRRSVRHRGHFPTEQAALKVLYLTATARRVNRQNLTGQINGWKQILNTLTIHYGDRISI